MPRPERPDPTLRPGRLAVRICCHGVPAIFSPIPLQLEGSAPGPRGHGLSHPGVYTYHFRTFADAVATAHEEVARIRAAAPCPDCNGEGEVWSQSPLDGRSGYPMACGSCAGSGVSQEPDRITDHPAAPAVTRCEVCCGDGHVLRVAVDDPFMDWCTRCAGTGRVIQA